MDLFSNNKNYIYKINDELYEIKIPKKLFKNEIINTKNFINVEEIIVCKDSSNYMKIEIFKSDRIIANSDFLDSEYFKYLNYNNNNWNSIGIMKMYYHYYATHGLYFACGLNHTYKKQYGKKPDENILLEAFTAIKAIRFDSIEFRFQYIKNENLISICETQKRIELVRTINVKKIK
ncbi:MAG: hypothetical protein IPH57_08050 [Saprospiraceae bacterium]|nr:hypothetical protein [Saprospiraceae bacterium]